MLLLISVLIIPRYKGVINTHTPGGLLAMPHAQTNQLHWELSQRWERTREMQQTLSSSTLPDCKLLKSMHTLFLQAIIFGWGFMMMMITEEWGFCSRAAF